MARVYLAESLGSGLLRKLVVLKVLNQELSSDPEMRHAFIREAEISSRLNHPNIVNVHEVFEQGTTAVMVMQHLEGLTLSEIMSRLKGAIPLKLHLNILCQLLDALHYFHELKDSNGTSLETVHRDVSPDNVMVLHEGGVKVVDFGVAKVRAQSENQTRAGVIKGKIAYMPPEQLLACATVDRRADIYSVGVMLWEAVAGRRMWRGMDASARMRAIIRGEIPDIKQVVPGVSDTLAKIIARALAHTPDGRYASAEEMHIELEQVSLTEGGYSAPRELAEFMRKNFGEERRERQRAIEKVVSDREYSLAGASFSLSAPATTIHESSSVQGGLAAPSVVTTNSTRPRKSIVAIAALGALGLIAGVVVLSSSREPQSAAMPSESASSVTVRVASDLSGADVYLDGIKVGVTPLVLTRPASAQPAKVELRAAGGVVQSKLVSLQEDVALSFKLQGEANQASDSAKVAPTHVQTVEESEEDAPSATPQNDEPARRPVAGRPARPVARPQARPAASSADKSTRGAVAPVEAAPAPAAAPKTAAEDSCDPPYRLDPGGVKVFKPHCF